MNTNNSKLKGVIIIVVILLILAVGYYWTKNKNIESEHYVKSVDVVASGGVFTPNQIDTEISGDVDLTIRASDRDYEFKVEGYPRFDTTIMKGETKTIQLYSLGVGSYQFTCGSNCNGTIVVNQRPD